MFLQSSWFCEGFPTRITVVISLSFMQYLDVILHRLWWSKEPLTRTTFEFFLAFLMIVSNMQIQSTLRFKYSVAHIACKIFYLSMNIFYMFSFVLSTWQGFFTNITFEIIYFSRWFHFKKQMKTNWESQNYQIFTILQFSVYSETSHSIIFRCILTISHSIPSWKQIQKQLFS